MTGVINIVDIPSLLDNSIVPANTQGVMVLSDLDSDNAPIRYMSFSGAGVAVAPLNSPTWSANENEYDGEYQ